MLNPDVVNTCELLSDIYNNSLGIKKYARFCNSLFVGKPGDIDPEWLISVRNRAGVLKDAMVTFSNDHPDILADIYYPFINYQTLFSTFAKQSKTVTKKEDWVMLLQGLNDALDEAIAKTDHANQLFKKNYQSVSNIQPLFDASIKQGWASLADEEAQMVALATSIGALQQSILQLSDNLTASDLRSGKAYVQSTATIAYGLVMSAEVSIPFLSFAAVLFTIGSSLYEVISSSEKIQQDIKNLTKLQNEASAEAQAAAATKAVIQLLFDLEKSFLKIKDNIPAILQMWRAEKAKVTGIIQALRSGADPKLYFDLQTMQISSAGWSTFFELVLQLQKPLANGDSVSISVGQVSKTHD